MGKAVPQVYKYSFSVSYLFGGQDCPLHPIAGPGHEYWAFMQPMGIWNKLKIENLAILGHEELGLFWMDHRVRLIRNVTELILYKCKERRTMTCMHQERAMQVGLFLPLFCCLFYLLPRGCQK